MFTIAFDFTTYGLQNRINRYDKNMAERTAKLVKQMETSIKPYNFGDFVCVTLLSFLGQLKKACDSNGLPKGLAMWSLPFFMANPTVASAKI